MLRPCRLVQSDYRPVRQRGTRPQHLYVPAGDGESAVLALDRVVAGGLQFGKLGKGQQASRFHR